MRDEKTVKGLWAVVKINANRSSRHIVPNYIPVKIADNNLDSVTFNGWAYGERLYEYPRASIMITVDTEEAAMNYIDTIKNDNNANANYNKLKNGVDESLLQDLQKDHKTIKDTYGQEVYDALDTYVENGNDLGDVLYKESEWNKFVDWAKKEKGIEVKSKVTESKSIKEDIDNVFANNMEEFCNKLDLEYKWGNGIFYPKWDAYNEFRNMLDAAGAKDITFWFYQGNNPDKGRGNPDADIYVNVEDEDSYAMIDVSKFPIYNKSESINEDYVSEMSKEANKVQDYLHSIGFTSAVVRVSNGSTELEVTGYYDPYSMLAILEKLAKIGYKSDDVDGDFRETSYGLVADITKVNEDASKSINEGHQVQTYKGYELDWNEDNIDPEDGIANFDVYITKDGKTITNNAFNGFRAAKEYIDGLRDNYWDYIWNVSQSDATNDKYVDSNNYEDAVADLIADIIGLPSGNYIGDFNDNCLQTSEQIEKLPEIYKAVKQFAKDHNIKVSTNESKSIKEDVNDGNFKFQDPESLYEIDSNGGEHITLAASDLFNDKLKKEILDAGFTFKDDYTTADGEFMYYFKPSKSINEVAEVNREDMIRAINLICNGRHSYREKLDSYLQYRRAEEIENLSDSHLRDFYNEVRDELKQEENPNFRLAQAFHLDESKSINEGMNWTSGEEEYEIDSTLSTAPINSIIFIKKSYGGKNRTLKFEKVSTNKWDSLTKFNHRTGSYESDKSLKDKYINGATWKLEKAVDESKSINEDINDPDEVLNFKRDVESANDLIDIQNLIWGLSDGVAEESIQQAFDENETEDLQVVKDAVIRELDIYLEDNEWLGENVNVNESETRKRISYRGYIIRPRKSDDGELYWDIIKPKWSTTEPIWDWCDSVEEAKQWIDSDKDEPFEESKSIKEDCCPHCGKQYAEDGRCYNQDCDAYDPISQYFDEPNEELNESSADVELTEDEKDDILFTVAMGFESGHHIYKDFEDFKSEFENISHAKAGWEYYCELVNLGPAGFYAEHKDDYIFDDMFIAEYGGESDEDEGPYLGKGKVSVTAWSHYGPGELPYWSGKKFDAKEWPEILKHFADTSHGSRPFEVLSVDGSEVSGWYVYNNKTGEYVFTTSNPQELFDKFNDISESINNDLDNIQIVDKACKAANIEYDDIIDDTSRGLVVLYREDKSFNETELKSIRDNIVKLSAKLTSCSFDEDTRKIEFVFNKNKINESEGRKATHTSTVYLVDYEDGMSLPFDDRDTAIDYAIDSDAKQVVKATMYHFSDDESDTDIDGDNSEVIWTAYPNPTTENLEESSKPDLYNVVDIQNDEHPDNSRVYTQAQMHDFCKELIEIEEASSEPEQWAKRPKLDYDLKSITAVLKWFDYEVKPMNTITEHYDDSPENYDNASRVLDNIEFVARETGELDDEDWTKDMMQQTVNVLDDSVKELQDIVNNLPTAASVNESYDPFNVYSVYEIKNADTGEIIRKIHTTSIDENDPGTWFDDDDIVSQFAGDDIIITRYDYDQNMLDGSKVLYPEENEDDITEVYDCDSDDVGAEDLNESETVQKWAIFADDKFQMYVNGTEDMAKEAIADMQKADEEDKSLFIAHGLDMPVYRYELVKYVQSANPEISNMFKVEENFTLRQSNGIVG